MESIISWKNLQRLQDPANTEDIIFHIDRNCELLNGSTTYKVVSKDETPIALELAYIQKRSKVRCCSKCKHGFPGYSKWEIDYHNSEYLKWKEKEKK